MTGELTLADVAREFLGWDCWRAVSGLYVARRHGSIMAEATGEDPQDLRDQIIRAIRTAEGQGTCT